jgi:hypothetical protein
MLGSDCPVTTRLKSAGLAESTRFSTVSRFSLALPAPAPPVAEPIVTVFSALQSNELSWMGLGLSPEKAASVVSPWIAPEPVAPVLARA